jgi:hypothetical protein
MYITPEQMIASLVMSILLMALIVRLVQTGKLDITYCWIWLGVGLATILVVIRYDWLVMLSHLIGSKTQTTTLFLLAHFVILLMCLQFSLVISRHRREIRRLTQRLAVLQATEDGPSSH